MMLLMSEEGAEVIAIPVFEKAASQANFARSGILKVSASSNDINKRSGF